MQCVCAKDNGEKITVKKRGFLEERSRRIPSIIYGQHFKKCLE